MMNLFYTKSTNLCAYLMMQDHEVKGTQKGQDGKVTFYFERTDNLEKSIKDYNEDAHIKKFISCFKEVKKLMH